MLLRSLSSVEKVIWRFREVAPLNFTMITRIHGPLELSQLRSVVTSEEDLLAYVE